MDVKDYVKLLHDLKILEIKVANIFEKRLEISLTRFQIIKYLYEVEVATSKQLAQLLEIDAAAITRHLKILEEGEYITKSNIESGLGRYDFLIEPKNKSKRAFIMEFKSTDSVEKLEEVSKEALKQIEDKKYDISLKQKEITYIGIAFCGKQIKISYK